MSIVLSLSPEQIQRIRNDPSSLRSVLIEVGNNVDLENYPLHEFVSSSGNLPPLELGRSYSIAIGYWQVPGLPDTVKPVFVGYTHLRPEIPTGPVKPQTTSTGKPLPQNVTEEEIQDEIGGILGGTIWDGYTAIPQDETVFPPPMQSAINQGTDASYTRDNEYSVSDTPPVIYSQPEDELNAASAIIDSSAVSVSGDLDATIQEAQTAFDNVSSTIQGELDYELDQVQELVDKNDIKIITDAATTLGGAYGDAYQIGIQYPSVDDIISGNWEWNPPGMIPPPGSPPGGNGPGWVYGAEGEVVPVDYGANGGTTTTGGGYPPPIIDTRPPMTGGGFPPPIIDTRPPMTGGGYPTPPINPWATPDLPTIPGVGSCIGPTGLLVPCNEDGGGYPQPPSYPPPIIDTRPPMGDGTYGTPTTGGGYPLPGGNGVTCPAPVVNCPAPPAINFSPNIVVNVPETKYPGCETPAPDYVPDEPVDDNGYAPEEPADATYIPEEELESSVGGTIKPVTPTSTKPEEVTEPPKSGFTSSVGYEGWNWSSDTPCSQQQATIGDYKTFIYEMMGYTRSSDGSWNYPTAIKVLWDIPVFGHIVFSTAAGVYDYVANGVMQITRSIGHCSLPQMIIPIAMRVVSGVVTRWLGFDADYLTRGVQYDINFLCPQDIPSPSEFVGLYLSNAISEETMACMVKANGSHDSWWRKIADSQRTKPNISEVISLNRRGFISDEDAYTRIRESGVTNRFEMEMFYKAAEATPTPADIVRFMVRDADDSTVATKYGTDAGFISKYGDRLKSWARAQGMTDEVMQYYWRSHWEIPSNTQLYEMLHRLRPDRRVNPIAQGLTTTIKDVEEALQVNDVLPFWAKRLVEISYHPLTRTDAQRAFMIDAVGLDELYDSFRDLGYDSNNAERLVKFNIELKKQRQTRLGAGEKAAKVLRFYLKYVISEKETFDRLIAGGLSKQAATDAIKIASRQRQNESQLECVKGIRGRFRKFIIDDVDAKQELIKVGLPMEGIEQLVNQWKCERSYKQKELTAAELCDAWKKLMISDEEYFIRMKRLGYLEDEAILKLELCQTKKSKGGATAPTKTPEQAKAEAMKRTETIRAIQAAAMASLETEDQAAVEPPIPDESQ